MSTVVFDAAGGAVPGEALTFHHPAGSDFFEAVQADGDVTYWQREEWCKWAKDEVLPKVTVALAAQAKQGGAA